MIHIPDPTFYDHKDKFDEDWVLLTLYTAKDLIIEHKYTYKIPRLLSGGPSRIPRHLNASDYDIPLK